MTRPVVCFGEVLLRFAPPGRELLLQSPQMAVTVAGAEANVAVALASFGTPSRMLTVLPDNVLGRAALSEIRKHGVDTNSIALGAGRMGSFFLTPGAVRRPPEVLIPGGAPGQGDDSGGSGEVVRQERVGVLGAACVPGEVG